MYVVAAAWIYVVGMMAMAEALSPVGSVLGAVITFLFYGLLPLSIVIYVGGAGARRRARQAAEASSTTPAQDGGGHPAGAAVAPERKEA